MPSDADADAVIHVSDIRKASKMKSEFESLRSDVATLTEIVLDLRAKVSEGGHAPASRAETRGDEPPPTITDVPQTPHSRTVQLCGAEIKSSAAKGVAKTCKEPAKYDEDGEFASVSGKPALYCGKHRPNKPPRKDKGKKRDVENATTETTTGSDDSDGGGGSKRTRGNEPPTGTDHGSAQKMPRVDSSLGKEYMNVLDQGSNQVSFTMIETGGSATDEATATSPPRPKRVKDPLVTAFDSPGSPKPTGFIQTRDHEAPPVFQFEDLFGHQQTLEQEVRQSSPELAPIVDPLLGVFNPWEA